MDHEIASVQKQLTSVWPNWQITRRLGKGSYGVVYEILRNDLGTTYRCALKALSMESEEDIPVAFQTGAYAAETTPVLSRNNDRQPRSGQISYSRKPDRQGSLLEEAPQNLRPLDQDPALQYRINERTIWDTSTPGSGIQPAPNLLFRSISGTEINDFIRSVSSEIDMMMQLKGVPNIVTIEDYAILREKRRCTILIRMEELESLEGYMQRQGGALRREEIIRLGTDICNALHFCEQKNILHRDIKISNLFYSKEAGFKLGDFGISRTMESIKVKAAMTGAGTIQYMAPEVYRGIPYNNTSDLYSLGIVLYILTNGFIPPLCAFTPGSSHSYIPAAEVQAANMRRLQGQPLPPPKYADDALASIILSACAPAMDRRFQTADAFRNSLKNCLMRTPVYSGRPASAGPSSAYGSGPASAGRSHAYGFGPASAGRPHVYGSGPESAGPSNAYRQGYDDRGKSTTSGNSSPYGRISLVLLTAALFFAISALALLLLRGSGRAGNGQGSASSSALTAGSTESTDDPEVIDSVVTAAGTGASGNEAPAAPDPGRDDPERNDPSSPDPTAPIAWTDTSLQAAVEPQIRSALGITPDTAITYADALRVQELNLKDCGITDLSDLSLFIGLTSLNLQNNFVKDTTPLSGLYKLKELNLEENLIEDVSPLAGLTGLQRLDLYTNNVSDITPLSGLTNLTNLDLRSNNVSDISALRNMTAMKELYLSDNRITDISVVQNMDSLTYLGLKHNPVSDISAAAGKQHLERLILAGTYVQDISMIDGLPALIYLDITGCPIKDKEPARRYDKRPKTQLEQ